MVSNSTNLIQKYHLDREREEGEPEYVFMKDRWWMLLGYLMLAAAAINLPFYVWLDIHGR